MKNIGRFNFGLCALASAMLMVSCLKEEIISIAPETVESETIAFSAVTDWGEHADVITKSGASYGNRIGKHSLLAEDGTEVLPMGVYVQDGIHSERAISSVATKGSKITSLSSFTVWGSLTGTNETNLFFPAEGLQFTDTDGIFHSNPAYFWPGAGTLDFVAVGNPPASGFTPNLNADRTALESFSYTVPADATAQNDIVVASAPRISGSLNASHPLDFKHIMSAVNVKVGSLPSAGGTFESIAIRNVYNSGTYDVATNSWTRGGTKSDYIILDTSSDLSTGTTVNSNEQTLMVLPQDLPDDAIIEVKYLYAGASEPATLTASISKIEIDGTTVNQAWDQGKTTYYTISIDENFNLSVTSQGNVLDAHYIMTTATVNVTELGENLQWYLTVSADGITEENVSVIFNDNNVNSYIKDGYWINSKDGDVASVRGTQTLTGTSTGTYEVLIFIPENISTGDRRITLEYGIVGNEANAKKEYLYQKCPYWDTTNNWGWEKVDDQNSGTYGFDWTKVVCYVTTYDLRDWGAYSQDDVLNTITEILTSLGLPTAGINANDASSYDSNSFITIDTYDGMKHLLGSIWYKSGTRMAVIIDYTKLDFDDAMSPDDGLGNTKAFFYGASMLAFEEALNDVLKNDGSGERFFRNLSDAELNSGKFNFHNYTYNGSTAMFIDNGGGVDDASGILNYIIKKNAYDIVTITEENYVYTSIDMDANDISWYLPAKNQYTNYKGFEFATGDATFEPADFWSSTAAENRQAYTGEGVAIDRSEMRKVIVQRKMSDTVSAALSTDNTSLTGGDNGSTDNWVE